MADALGMIMWLCIAGFAVCVRVLQANNRTYGDRGTIIQAIFDDRVQNYPNPVLRWEHLEAVSYSRHLFAIVLFRDPFKLYAEPVRAALSEAQP